MTEQHRSRATNDEVTRNDKATAATPTGPCRAPVVRVAAIMSTMLRFVAAVADIAERVINLELSRGHATRGCDPLACKGSSLTSGRARRLMPFRTARASRCCGFARRSICSRRRRKNRQRARGNVQPVLHAAGSRGQGLASRRSWMGLIKLRCLDPIRRDDRVALGIHFAVHRGLIYSWCARRARHAR